jgi:hypothetical protein
MTRRDYDAWRDFVGIRRPVESDSDDDSDENDSSAFNPDLEEEMHERPLTDKQRAKLDSKAARKARPTMDDAARQLATKLLDDHGRLYTEEDLDEDVHLARALKLIHSKKLGLPFDTVPGVHIKVRDEKAFLSELLLTTLVQQIP